MWSLLLMSLRGGRDVDTEADEIGGDVVMWPLKLIRWDGMS